MTHQCMKKTCAATSTLAMSNNSMGDWYYCTEHAKEKLLADADGNIPPMGIRVQYVWPADGASRADLSADALALCR